MSYCYQFCEQQLQYSAAVLLCCCCVPLLLCPLLLLCPAAVLRDQRSSALCSSLPAQSFVGLVTETASRQLQ